MYVCVYIYTHTHIIYARGNDEYKILIGIPQEEKTENILKDNIEMGLGKIGYKDVN
jgi:hypothetical protein